MILVTDKYENEIFLEVDFYVLISDHTFYFLTMNYYFKFLKKQCNIMIKVNIWFN